MKKQNKTITLDIEKLNDWRKILDFWADYIEELSWQFPRTKRKYEKFADLLDDMAELTKQN